MIIQNTGQNQLAVAVAGRHVGNDVPKAAIGPPASPSPAAEVQAAQAEPSAKQLHVAVNTLNQMMSQANRNLKFTVDTATNQRVVQVVDTETGELIRQIPSREMLAVAQSIDEFLQRGALLKQKA